PNSRLLPKTADDGQIVAWSASQKRWVAQDNSGGSGFDPSADQNITGSYVYEKSTVTSPITITGERNGSYGMLIENTSNGTSAGSQLLLYNDLGASAQWYSSSSNVGHAYGANTLFLRQVANGAFRFVTDSSNDFYFGPSIYGNSPYAIFSNTLIRFDKNVAIGYTSASARLDVTGDGINPIAIFRDNALNATVKLVNGYLSGGGISLGSYTTNVGGIWNGTLTPNNSNYALVTTNIYTFLNAVTQVQFKLNHADQGFYNSNGWAFGTSTITQNGTITVKGSGGKIQSWRNSADIEKAAMGDTGDLTISNTLQAPDVKTANVWSSSSIISFKNSAYTGAPLITIGPATVLFPAIKANGTTLEIYLGDGSGYTSLKANKLFTGSAGGGLDDSIQTANVYLGSIRALYTQSGRPVFSFGSLTAAGIGINIDGSITTATTGTLYHTNHTGTIALNSAGNANVRYNSIEYTVTNGGAQTGNLTGFFLNATETALNGMSHNLMDLQVGGVSKFKVLNNGLMTASYATIASFSIGTYTGRDLKSTSSHMMNFNTNSITVGENYTAVPNYASALFAIDSTVKGFLLPRMTTVNRDGISSPAIGLLLYDTTLNMLSVYTSNWEQFVTNKTNMVVGADYEFFFTDASGNPFGTKDLGFKRGSAGVLEITDGSTGCGAIKSCYFQSRDLSAGGLATATRMRFGSTGAVGDGGLTALGIDTQLAVEVDSTILYIPCSTSQFS
ncbi:MAG: hypothetical protein K9J84_13915, partial [Bacteroidia bacterium]|nr:hypothetical protein [Bacteroidia bacterium]